jgi:hypothetical protein
VASPKSDLDATKSAVLDVLIRLTIKRAVTTVASLGDLLPALRTKIELLCIVYAMPLSSLESPGVSQAKDGSLLSHDAIFWVTIHPPHVYIVVAVKGTRIAGNLKGSSRSFSLIGMVSRVCVVDPVLFREVFNIPTFSFTRLASGAVDATTSMPTKEKEARNKDALPYYQFMHEGVIWMHKLTINSRTNVHGLH